jgi:catechol 2,3-dioxygenase-like lactoylglutathione lyase family enzyme
MAPSFSGPRVALEPADRSTKVRAGGETIMKRARVRLGAVGHFSLAVKDPGASAAWWTKLFDLDEIFRFDGGVGLSNDAITIVFFKGKPNAKVIEHMSFHVGGMKALRAALKSLEANGVDLEDPGDEIGPEAPGSPHMGLWFHDPDGYRWELSVQNGAPGRRNPRREG